MLGSGANTSIRFFCRLRRVNLLVQLLPLCRPILMKNKNITRPRLSVTSTSRTPVGWHRIQLTILPEEPDAHITFAPLSRTQFVRSWLKMEYIKQRTVSQPDSSLKKCPGSGGFQHRLTNVSVEIFFQKNLPMPYSC